MSRYVPSWDHDEPPNPSPQFFPSSSALQGPMSAEITELTWKDGHLAVHGLSTHQPKIGKPDARFPTANWEKPRLTTGTLESVVEEATRSHPDVLPWLVGTNQLDSSPTPAAADSLVPCAAALRRHLDDLASGVGSCDDRGRKRARVTEGGSVDMTDTWTEDFGSTTSTTPSLDDGGGSPDTRNGSFAGGGPDSICHSLRSQSQREVVVQEEEKGTKGATVRSSLSTKRSRAAAIHNQSERKRRDRINQKMRTLQKLVPNSSKIDKASMLDEVIGYLKQLQAQVEMMSRMRNMPPMTMSMNMQQLQMAMMTQMAHMTQMAQMGMGMHMGKGVMDINSLNRPGLGGIPSVLPTSAFTPLVGTDHRMQQLGGNVAPEPFSGCVACPPQQPMSMDAFQRMAGLFQQAYQLNTPSNPKP